MLPGWYFVDPPEPPEPVGTCIDCGDDCDPEDDLCARCAPNYCSVCGYRPEQCECIPEAE